jgi:DNA-binding CsgD family transcriptional regulator
MAAALPAPLIGRDVEVTACAQALDDLERGRGRLLCLVAGEGMGKSAVAGVLTDAADRRSIRTAWGRPMAGRRSDPPLATWARALQRLGRPLPPGLAEGADGGLDGARDAVLRAVGETPTVLVLDDVHRADPESRWLVEHLLDDLPQVPLLLAVALRPGDPAGDVDVGRWCAHRAATRLLLDGLPDRATADLLSALTGEPIDIAHPLVRFAEGSPAAAIDLAEQWSGEAGRRRLISRIATVVESHNGSRVLSMLAALERPCTASFEGNNAKTTTLSNMIRQPVEVTLALLHSAQLGGIVGRGKVEDQWAITHPMYADAALSDPVRTAAIRRQLAEALLVVEAEEGSGVVSAECAGQFVLAGQPRPDVSLRAVRHYLDTGQPKQARDLVIATVTTALDEEDQISLNRLAGVAFAALGEVHAADDYLHGMINRARVRGLTEEFAETVTDLLTWLPSIPDASRLELIDEALDSLPELDARTAIRLRAAAAHALVHTDPARAEELWAEADATDWADMDSGVIADVLALPSVHGCQADQVRILEAVHVLDGLDPRFGRGRALAAVGRLSLSLIGGTRDQMARALDDLTAALREWPSPELAAYGAAGRLALARFDADLDQLDAVVQSPAWLQAPPGSHGAILLGVGHLLWGQALGELPPLPDAAARAARIDAPRMRHGVELTALGITALADPDLAPQLRERFDAADPPEALPHDHRLIGHLVVDAAFAGAAGDVDRATRAADLLMPHLEEMAVVLPTGVSGPVGLHVAHARVAAGDLGAAEVALQAALRCCARAKAASWEALTHLLRARVAIAGDELALAEACLQAVERLTVRRPMAAVLQELGRLRAQLATISGEAGPRLSARELEVVQLVSHGATNREVARRLGISPKTVEYHLSGAFRALGAGNRTEAVQLARRARLLDVAP